MIIIGDCQYTLSGLICLLKKHNPTVLSTEEFYACEYLKDNAVLIIPRTTSLYNASKPFVKLRQIGWEGKTGVMCDQRQQTFIHACGFQTDVKIECNESVASIKRIINKWIRIPHRRIINGRKGLLTPQDKSVLAISMQGYTPQQCSLLLGISLGQYYRRRMRAYKRIGVRSAQELLSNPSEGIVEPATLYDGILW